MENKYTVRIALVVLMLLVFAGAYTGYNVYKNSPEGKAQQMLKAQEELLAEIAKDQAQMAEEAKKLIEEMEKKKAEQAKIYQAYLSGAKMDQAQLQKIQERLKNLEYCEAMMSYECFSNTASGAPVSSAPSHRYSLITTAYASDTPDDSMAHLPLDTHLQDDDRPIQYSQTRSEHTRASESSDSTPSVTDSTSKVRDRGTQPSDLMNQLNTLQASSTKGQETPEERTERKIQ